VVTLITADLHWSDNPRDQYRHDFVGWLLGTLKSHKVDRVLILGDLCEQKDYHSAWLVNKVVEHLDQISNCAQVTVLRGNHDYAASPDNPFFEFVHKIEGIDWINTPYLKGDELFLPHTTNYKRDWKKVDLAKAKWIFTHNTFAGAAVGPRTLEGIPTDIFPESVRVVSGDVHAPQEVGTVTYVGAPYTVDFGDDYQPRVLLLSSKDKLSSVPYKGPQKRLVTMTWPTMPDSMISPGDILKVRVQIEGSQYARWQEIKDKIMTWGDRNKYQIYMVQPVMVSPATKTASRRTDPKSDQELLETYAKQRNIDPNTLTVGLKLLDK
jgi:predicted phosphodiesterase